MSDGTKDGMKESLPKQVEQDCESDIGHRRLFTLLRGMESMPSVHREKAIHAENNAQLTMFSQCPKWAKNGKAYVRKENARMKDNEDRIKAHVRTRVGEYSEALCAVLAEQADQPASESAESTKPEPKSMAKSKSKSKFKPNPSASNKAIWWQDDHLYMNTVLFRECEL